MSIPTYITRHYRLYLDWGQRVAFCLWWSIARTHGARKQPAPQNRTNGMCSNHRTSRIAALQWSYQGMCPPPRILHRPGPGIRCQRIVVIHLFIHSYDCSIDLWAYRVRRSRFRLGQFVHSLLCHSSKHSDMHAIWIGFVLTACPPGLRVFNVLLWWSFLGLRTYSKIWNY